MRAFIHQHKARGVPSRPHKKAERLDISDKTLEDVPSTGAFSNQFLEGMKLLYELEPLIKVKPYLTNQWEKSGRLVKTAS